MSTDENDIQNLLRIVSRINVAMLTTSEPDGSLHNRPLATLRATEFRGVFWFFTAADSAKVSEISDHRDVNLSYSDPAHHCYASISGKGVITHDPEKMAEFWNPLVKIWFPDGLDDPNLVLLKVNVATAEYWDASGSRRQRIASFSNALKTGDSSAICENRKLQFVPK
jgi:general stress protein 26